MKTLLLSLCLLFAVTVSAQSLTYKQTSIKIYNDGGFSTTSNEIRYTIEADLSDIQTVIALFPDKTFKIMPDKVTYSSTVSVPDMWTLIDQFEIEEADLNKTVKEAIRLWSRNIIYSYNLLNLELEKWNLIN